jgi:hypothetical protein
MSREVHANGIAPDLDDCTKQAGISLEDIDLERIRWHEPHPFFGTGGHTSQALVWE